jgi:hypothetical protein
MQSNITAKGRYRFITYKKGTKEVLRVSPWINNLVTLANNHGLNLIARHLVGDDSFPLEITQAKIGTGTTPPTIADTDLETPVLSNIIVALSSFTGGVADFEFFMPDGELPDNEYTEFGIFCGDQMFARSIINPSYTKTTGEDTSCQYQTAFANKI